MRKRGIGIAATMYPTSTMTEGTCGAYLRVREDGSINLFIGCTELGQGSNTVLAQILAEELGVPIDLITVTSGDTEGCPHDVGAIASRQTHIGGNAVRAAALKIKNLLQDTVCELLEASPENLVFRDGMIYDALSPEKKVSFREAASVTHREHRIPLVAEGWYAPDISRGIDPETGRGEPFAAYEYQAVMAEVEVDTETGLVEVLRLHAAVESGRIINPLLAEAQTEGGIMQGMGFGLRENLHPYYPEVDGLSPDYSPHHQTTNLADYLIGTAEDVPILNEALIDYPDALGPGGAVGLGEFSVNCVGTAIANAIHEAVGVRIYSAPCTPERILAAMKAKENQSGAK